MMQVSCNNNMMFLIIFPDRLFPFIILSCDSLRWLEASKFDVKHVNRFSLEIGRLRKLSEMQPETWLRFLAHCFDLFSAKGYTMPNFRLWVSKD